MEKARQITRFALWDSHHRHCADDRDGYRGGVDEAGDLPRIPGAVIAFRAAGWATDAATGVRKGKAEKEKPGP